jgi:predicted Rossmann fold nucleotide-binding protein DprA/Smf involved in DNA uptake
MKKIAVVGSRHMSRYGKEVIKLLINNLKNKVEIVTINVFGCNKEIIRLGADKVFEGENFEKINNDVANYADVLVIIEGGKNSGTLLLAKNFVEKNKLVYCVPGRINDDNSFACNWLISQGAIPLINIDQII